MSSTTPVPPVVPRQRVVVGVDGSACSEAALAWALRQAVLLGADLEAVACWQTPVSISSGAGYGIYVDPSSYDLTGPTAEALEKTVAAASGEVAGAETVAVRTRVVHDYPVKALLEAAEGADLLVVGSRGHSELSSVLLGSVGLHCVTHAPCPVVVVRHPKPAQAPEA